MKKEKGFSSPYIWAFSTYFAEGFPFIIIRTVSSVFFRDMKVSLEAIGLTSLFGLPWIIKFLWAPQVDTYSTKRRWMMTMQALLLVMMVLAALFVPLSFGITAIAVLFFIGSFLAATHDIAIDGYYMEALDKDGQAKYVGYRVMAYRIAMMTGTGVIVTIGATVTWTLAFMAAAMIFGLFFCYHSLFLKEVERVDIPVQQLWRQFLRIKNLLISFLFAVLIFGLRLFSSSDWYGGIKNKHPVLEKTTFAHWVGVGLLLGLTVLPLFRKRISAFLLKNPDSHYGQAFITFMNREKMGLVLAFIILLRTGEWMLTTMVSPLIVDLGIKMHYGWISALVGLPASIIGAMIGGWMISRYSLKRMIWPFILLQNLTNIVYMSLAYFLSDFIILNTGAAVPVSIGAFNLCWVALVQAFDQFAGGLGTAVLMTYLMRICLEKYKAAHYAIGSGLMCLSGLFAGVSSGFIAASLGYAWLFGLSFLASVPAMVLIPFLPMFDKDLN